MPLDDWDKHWGTESFGDVDTADKTDDETSERPAIEPPPRPDVAALLPVDPAREFDPSEMLQFFELLAADYGPTEIALSLGWSPAMLKRFETEPSRAELMQMFDEAKHESVERGILRAARGGNATAMKIYAYNKMHHRGWSDRTKVEVTGRSQVEMVLSVREAIEGHIREVGAGNERQAVAELQAAFLEPDIPEHAADADIAEGEIVEDVHG